MHIRMRATIVLEYEADSIDYGTSDPAKMADIDTFNFNHDRDFFWQCVEDSGLIKVEPADASLGERHAERMTIMREVVEWLRAAPEVSCMAHSATNGVGLAQRTREMTASEASDELERQVEAGTA